MERRRRRRRSCAWNGSKYIYPILSWTFALEFDGAVAGSQLPLPSLLRRNYSDAFLVAIGQHAPRLPPLVVRGVGDVKDVAVAEKQSATRQSVVLVGVIVK